MNISSTVIPVVIATVLIYALAKKADIYSSFTLGAKDGLMTAFNIIPQLVGLLVAVKMFTASGAMGFVTKLMSPVSKIFGFPAEALPFAILRPISGSGSLAMATELFSKYGPDSFAGRVISVMMGSTETTFYAVSVYFGAVGIKNTRHTLTCALIADFVSMILSVLVCRMMF